MASSAIPHAPEPLMPNHKTRLAVLADVAVALDQAFDDYAKAQGLPLSEMQVLYSLYTHESQTQKQIGADWLLPKQTVHTVCKHLHEKGVVQTVPHEGDRREKRLALTQAGRAYAETAVQPLLRLEEETEQAFGSDRLQALIDEFSALQQLFSQVAKREHQE